MPGDEQAPISTVAKKVQEPPSYWQAVISALPPDKQAAAWRFFQERELGAAVGALDTLSGLILLMEANGLYMDGCAQRLAGMFATFEARLKAIPAVQGAESAEARPVPPATPENIGPLTNRMTALVQRMEAAGEDSMSRLEKLTTAHEAAAERHRKASRFNDLLFLLSVLLAVAILGALIGFFYAQRR
jgi:hypothetical protein